MIVLRNKLIAVHQSKLTEI